MTAPCRCGEPLEAGHACWATQAAELEALRAEVAELRLSMSRIEERLGDARVAQELCQEEIRACRAYLRSKGLA